MGIFRDNHYHISNPTRTEYVTKEVNINRQSTADDARLLKELEREAEAKIDSVIYGKLEPLNVEYGEVVTQYNPLTNNEMMAVYVNINGHGVKKVFEMEEGCRFSPREAVKKVSETIAKELAHELTARFLCNEECRKYQK